MLLPWPDGRCIFCGATGALTNGHVIPRAVGGQLAASFECADCNHSMGSTFEARLVRDPAVRHAAESLVERLGGLGVRLRQRQRYVAYDGTIRVEGVGHGTDVRMLDTPQDDRALVMESTRAAAAIEKMLRRAGVAKDGIDAALARMEAAAPDRLVELGHGLTVRQGSITAFQPDLAGERPVQGACLAAIAYRFLALLTGPAILHSGLHDLRDQLRRGEVDGFVIVAATRAQRPPEPWHGIGVNATKPVTIDVRLFGQLAWLVTFATVALPPDWAGAAYRIDLDHGIETFGGGLVLAA